MAKIIKYQLMTEVKNTYQISIEKKVIETTTLPKLTTILNQKFQLPIINHTVYNKLNEVYIENYSKNVNIIYD